MVKEFLDIKGLSDYLGIKKTTLYGIVENGDLPHYRIGRLIRFRRDEVDTWMEKYRSEGIETGKEKTKRTIKSVSKPKTNIDRIIKNAIDESKGLKYNPSLGNQVKSGIQEGGEHGLV